MFKNVTPEKAAAFVRYCVALACCWPPSLRKAGFEETRFKICRSLTHLNACLVFPGLMYSLFLNFNDYSIFSKAAWQSIAVAQVIVNTSIGIVQYDRFQQLIAEMEECYKGATSYEKYIYQQYVDKYFAFYALSALWFYITAFVASTGTLFLPQPLPYCVEYPFPADYQPLTGILFLHHTVVMYQCSAHVSMSIFCAFFLFFAAARFDILKTELRQVTNPNQLIRCMKQYHIIKRYAENVSYSVRPLALVTVIACCMVLVFCAISFIQPQPFSVRVQSMPILCTGLIEVYLFAWPADLLLDQSESVMEGIYESRWYEQSRNIQKSILIMLVPQAAVGIKVLYIIPTLSLNYFCSFVSNVMSLFTVLRAALQDE